MTLIEAAIAAAPLMLFLALCVSEPSFTGAKRRFEPPHVVDDE